jgi:hypothetical protein
MRIDGQCHCGYITYEAVVDPEKVEICHCTDCQTLSGSAFRTVVPTPEENVTLLSGKPSVYVKTGESGAKRIQAFCPKCGTPIYSTAVGDGPKFYGIRVGTVRQRDQLPPKKQYWVRSAQQWVDAVGSIPKVEVE